MIGVAERPFGKAKNPLLVESDMTTKWLAVSKLLKSNKIE
jgi:hypothetical protein